MIHMQEARHDRQTTVNAEFTKRDLQALPAITDMAIDFGREPSTFASEGIIGDSISVLGIGPTLSIDDTLYRQHHFALLKSAVVSKSISDDCSRSYLRG